MNAPPGLWFFSPSPVPLIAERHPDAQEFAVGTTVQLCPVCQRGWRGAQLWEPGTFAYCARCDAVTAFASGFRFPRELVRSSTAWT